MPRRRMIWSQTALDTMIPVHQPSESPSLLMARDSSSSGLTNGQIGGLVGGLVGMLIVCLGITVWVIRHLHKLAAARQNGAASGRHGHRRSRGGSGGGPGGHASSGQRPVRQSKMEPTPSQVERLDYDDLLEREPNATVAEGTAAVPNSGASDAGGPPSVANLSVVASLGGSIKSGSIRRLSGPPVEGELDGTDAQTTMLSFFQEQERRKAWLRFQEAQEHSAKAGGYYMSEAGSSVQGTPRKPAELGVDGGLIPELPSGWPPETDAATAERHTTLERQWRVWKHQKVGIISESPDQHDQHGPTGPAEDVEMDSGVNWQSMGRRQTEQTR